MSDHQHPHIRTSYISSAIYRRSPRFTGAAEFGKFLAVLRDRWQSPPIASTSAAMIELAMLGCRVQSTPHPSAYEPSLIDHLSWARPMILTIAREVGAIHVTRWMRVDVLGRSQADVARHEGITRVAVCRSVGRVRDAIDAELMKRGYLHV